MITCGASPGRFSLRPLVIYSVVVVYPMVYSAYLSLFRWDGISAKHKYFLTSARINWIFINANANQKLT
jgi:ABC-type sugar transport system permease subunit